MNKGTGIRVLSLLSGTWLCIRRCVTEDEDLNTDKASALKFPQGADLIQLIYCSEGCIRFNHTPEDMEIGAGQTAVACGLFFPNGDKQKSICSCQKTVIFKSENDKREYTDWNEEDFRGIAIIIDINEAAKTVSSWLDNGSDCMDTITRILIRQRRCFTFGKDERTGRIMDEIYQAIGRDYLHDRRCIDENTIMYIKVKVIELLVIMGIDMENKENRNDVRLSSTQISAVRQAAAYMSKMKDRHVSASELAKKFNISTGYLQTAFKRAYGSTMRSYARETKMKAAALRLVETELSVIDIAAEYGYDNASKFSAAFKKVMGKSPKEYRNCFKNVLLE